MRMPSLAAAGSLRDRGAILAGRAAGVTARRMRRGGGTALPGLVAGTIAPGLIDRLAATPEEGVVTITGTNGKTTTTHLLAAIAAAHGWEAITNRSGSNLERGLVTAYLEHISARSDIAPGPRRVALLEVDEAVLPRLFPRLRPRAAVFLNLFRDQLDRYGEVDSVAEGWGRMLDDAPGVVHVLNVDDPSVAVLASRGEGPAIGFGVEDDGVALEEADHASDARFCPCGARFAYDAIYMGHVGRWRCDACGTRRPEPQVVARRVRLEPDVTTIDLEVAGETALLRIPFAGLYSVYNTLGAAAAAHALGVPADVIVSVLSTAGPAFGRQERFTLEGRHVRVLLAKNPAGMNELVRALLAVEGPFTLLAMLNDGVQDGQDVSWIYDADLERLAPRAPVLVCSGDRADDLALRCSIAGMTPAAVLPETERALDAALERTPPGGRLEVLATYTAMLDVRESLARRAGAGAYWERGDD
jgi:lipid II isoglutaminyl synthase (glutamine-hydrolysing)